MGRPVISAQPLCEAEGGQPPPGGVASGHVHARSGDRLRAAVWTPAGAARGSVVLSPGRTEAIEKYGEVVGELLGRGFAVLCHDWVGQGLSDRLHRDRLRGHIRGGAGRFLADLADVIAAYEDRLPRPWIGLGHSMGGGLTALAAIRTPTLFDAVLLTAPMMGVLTGSQPPGRVRLAARLMCALGRGAALPLPQQDPLRDTFEHNDLTHDRARFDRAQALLAAFPDLRLGGPTWSWLRFAFDLSDSLARAGAAEGLRSPVAVLTAGEEGLVDNAAIEAFARRLPDATLEQVPGARHEILMETDAVRAVFWRAFDRLADAAAHPEAAAPHRGAGGAATLSIRRVRPRRAAASTRPARPSGPGPAGSNVSASWTAA